MDKNKKKQLGQMRRRRRIRAKVAGTPDRPRLSVFRSNLSIYLQVIDDKAGKTLASAHTAELKDKKKSKTEQAFALGKLIAAKAREQKLESVVFDKSGYKYHGRVKAAAEGAREGGLKF